MTRLQCLEQDFHAVCRVFDGEHSDEEYRAAGVRQGELLGAINRAVPTSIGDCVVKLRLLADPEIGMPAGDRCDDFVALRQVVDYLAGL